MAREKGGEGVRIRRPGHGTHDGDESVSSITGTSDTVDGDSKLSPFSPFLIPNLPGAKDGPISLEDGYMSVEVSPWREQLTARGLVVSFILGILFCVITHKLNLTVGIIPSLNISAGWFGFFFLRLWTTLFTKLGFFSKPFTRQEHTVIQTCVVSCYGLAFSVMHSHRITSSDPFWHKPIFLACGFGSYILGMDQQTHDQVNTQAEFGGDIPGNENVKNPGLAWMMAFTATVSFVGIFSIVVLRKV